MTGKLKHGKSRDGRTESSGGTSERRRLAFHQLLGLTNLGRAMDGAAPWRGLDRRRPLA
jgi:hypothetical protein